MRYNDDEWGWPKAAVAIILLIVIAVVSVAVLVMTASYLSGAKIVITKPDGTEIVLPESASPEQLRALNGE